MKKEKIAWIDHMKLFASIMIMTAHFQDAALDACLAPPAQSGLYDILNTILVPFQTGKCWVIVFCLLSGYLSCRKVSSLRELAAESFARWLRFFLPLLLAAIHVAFAFSIITKLLAALYLTDVGLFALVTVITFAVFALVYIIVYSLTARTYYRIVSQ